jgi:D-glycero-D-manno-heptose 1,7-bisphosphate phosphatase
MANAAGRRAAAFLDRDGVLNPQPPPHEYLTSAEAFEWLPGAREGAARLAGAGYVLAVVSNQRGVSRGLVNEEALSGIEARIQAGLAQVGCRIEAFRYCPHGLDDGCDCRKPKPGMLLDLARELDLELATSWMIGDSTSDIDAGRAAGCHVALVGEGDADVVGPSLDAVAGAIVAGGAA